MSFPKLAGKRATRRDVLVGAAAGLALAGCARSEDMTKRQGPLADPVGHTVEVDGVPIHCVRIGEGPPVVLIHGASGNLNDMTFRVAPAVAESHTVVAFDRPGHGTSGWPAGGGETLSLQAALMRGALAQMGIPRATVIGHSYGGSVAIAWALDAPESVERLMLLAAPSEVWPGGLGLSTDLLANPITGPLLARTLPALVTPGFARSAADKVFAPQTAPPGYIEHLDLGLVLQSASLRANALQLAALKPQVESMVPRYSGLTLPVEILHGTADTTVPIQIHSEVLVTQLPRARLSRLDGIGHMLHQVDLPAVMTALGRLDSA